MCTWKTHRQAETQRKIFMILVALLFFHPYSVVLNLLVSFSSHLFLHPGFSFDLDGYHNHILRRSPPLPKKKRLDHRAQNPGNHLIKLQSFFSTTGTTPRITYKNNFCNFQKLLCFPFLIDVHHKPNLGEMETMGKMCHQVSVPYCYSYCKEVPLMLNVWTLKYFFFLNTMIWKQGLFSWKHPCRVMGNYVSITFNQGDNTNVISSLWFCSPASH